MAHLEKGVADSVLVMTVMKASAIHLHHCFSFLPESNIRVVGLLFYKMKPTNYMFYYTFLSHIPKLVDEWKKNWLAI